MNDSPLNAAIRDFEIVETNLVKLEKVLAEIEVAVPNGIAFGLDDEKYENNCRSFNEILKSLPKIDGWKPEITLMSLDGIAQERLDAQDISELEVQISVERNISEPGRLVREYRYKFGQKRRELIRDAVGKRIDAIDENLRELSKLPLDIKSSDTISHKKFDELKENVGQIDMLLGNEKRPERWGMLARHIYFGMAVDLHDIIEFDWPGVKEELRTSLYGEKEAVPTGIDDLGAIVNAKPKGAVTTQLHWKKLSEEDFERLIFELISSEQSYENPEWLTKTNAPDRGRDLSVYT